MFGFRYLYYCGHKIEDLFADEAKPCGETFRAKQIESSKKALYSN